LYWIVTNINVEQCNNPHSAQGFANITAGTCYKQPNGFGFTRISCTSGSGYLTELYSANEIGCDSAFKLLETELQNYCGTSNQQIYCSFPPTAPAAPSSTPSSPPTLSPTPSAAPTTCTCPPTANSQTPTGRAASLAPIGLLASTLSLLALAVIF
jgi:hypothetical protein